MALDQHGALLKMVVIVSHTILQEDHAGLGWYGSICLSTRLWYDDPQCNPHGSLWEQNGAFTVVDVPNSVGTFPTSINDTGEITGWAVDVTGAGLGFIRDSRGTITTFDIPNVRDFGAMAINSA